MSTTAVLVGLLLLAAAVVAVALLSSRADRHEARAEAIKRRIDERAAELDGHDGP